MSTAQTQFNDEILHEVDISEEVDGSAVAYKAYCLICEWCEDHWHHEDSEPWSYETADAAGREHAVTHS